MRSVKYIVEVAAASESTGIQAATICTGVDNTTLGQTSVVDSDVPVGSKILVLDIRAPKVNLTAVAAFTHWSLQRQRTGQSVVNPISAGGNALRTNIMLSGVIAFGADQNNQFHIRYKIPKRMQRIGDGDKWVMVMNNTAAISTIYEFVYKVFQ